MAIYGYVRCSPRDKEKLPEVLVAEMAQKPKNWAGVSRRHSLIQTLSVRRPPSGPRRRANNCSRRSRREIP